MGIRKKTSIREQMALIRAKLPESLAGDFRLYRFKKDYNENHFYSDIKDGTESDIKCHMLAGKWDSLELIYE